MPATSLTGGSVRRRRHRRAVAAIAVATSAVLLGAGCGRDGAAPSAGGEPPATTELAAPTHSAGCNADPATVGTRSSHERVDLTTAGADRWYARFVPSTYDGTALPLVIDLHGYLSGSAGQVAMSDLGSLADEAGFMVATPQGSSDLPYWNAVPHAELPDDVAFIDAIIDDVGATLCIDTTRVYVDGFSNGAFLASLVACRLSERVAAVATVAGLLLPEGCAPSRPIPVLAIHGTDDRFVSFAGPPNPALDGLAWNDDSRAAFDGLPFADVTIAAADWAALNGCGPQPARSEVASAVERLDYTDCAEGSTVQLYVLEGAGHTWPGSAVAAASASVVGPATDEIDANEIIWSFFTRHPLP